MSNRFSRQEKWVPVKALTANILVVGCGAVGKNVVETLASMGCTNITVFDHDKVEEHNCASQGWLESQIGMYKVQAVADNACQRYNACTINGIATKWKPSLDAYDAVFMCPDCMEARQKCFKYYRSKPSTKNCLIIDTRMRAEEIRLLTSFDEKSSEKHSEAFFSNAEAADGNCTTQTTLYASHITASLAIQKFVAYARGGIVEVDTIVNLFAGGVFVHS